MGKYVAMWGSRWAVRSLWAVRASSEDGQSMSSSRLVGCWAVGRGYCEVLGDSG